MELTKEESIDRWRRASGPRLNHGVRQVEVTRRRSNPQTDHKEAAREVGRKAGVCESHVFKENAYCTELKIWHMCDIHSHLYPFLLTTSAGNTLPHVLCAQRSLNTSSLIYLASPPPLWRDGFLRLTGRGLLRGQMLDEKQASYTALETHGLHPTSRQEWGQKMMANIWFCFQGFECYERMLLQVL